MEQRADQWSSRWPPAPAAAAAAGPRAERRCPRWWCQSAPDLPLSWVQRLGRRWGVPARGDRWASAGGGCCGAARTLCKSSGRHRFDQSERRVPGGSERPSRHSALAAAVHKSCPARFDAKTPGTAAHRRAVTMQMRAAHPALPPLPPPPLPRPFAHRAGREPATQHHSALRMGQSTINGPSLLAGFAVVEGMPVLTSGPCRQRMQFALQQQLPLTIKKIRQR